MRGVAADFAVLVASLLGHGQGGHSPANSGAAGTEQEHSEAATRQPSPSSSDSERQWWLPGILTLSIRFVDTAFVCVGEYNCFVPGGNFDVGRAGIVELCVSSRS